MRKTLITSLFILTLSSINAQDKTGFFFDPRDGQSYETIFIEVEKDGTTSTLEWMSSNLNYDSKDSRCYNDYQEYCNSYGRLYDWDESKEVCPDGWHLSTSAEWSFLLEKYGSKSVAGPAIVEGGASKLDLISAGFSSKKGNYMDIGINGYYWKTESYYSTSPGTITIHRGVDYVTDDEVDASHFNSVRCVKNY